MTKVIIIDSGFKVFRVKTGYKAGYDTFKGQDRTLFKTVFIAEIILEGNETLLPIDQGIVSLKPVNTKDDRMLDTGDIERQGFDVTGDGKGDLGMVDDRPMEAGLAVSHVEVKGLRVRGDGELVL